MSTPLALVALVALAAPLAVTLSACESSQSKNEKLANSAGSLEEEKGVNAGAANTKVSAGDVALITDENGSAVAVKLRNKDSKPQLDVPVIIDVKSKSGELLFTNGTAGLQRTLTHASVVPADSAVYWVNDQVFAAEPPEKVDVKVGASDSKSAAQPPKFTIASIGLVEDPVNGTAAVGKVQNPTGEDQRKILVSVVGEKSGKVVAIGRGVINKIKADKSGKFTVFFIGNPKGAKLNANAQATELK